MMNNHVVLFEYLHTGRSLCTYTYGIVALSASMLKQKTKAHKTAGIA